MKTPLLFIFIFILNACSIFKGTNMVNKLSFRKDIDLIISKMEEGHPGLHPDFKDKTFYGKWNKVKPRLNDLKNESYDNKYVFLNNVDNLLQELGSGHDHLSYNEEKNENKKEFPFRFELFSNNKDSNKNFQLILIKREGFILDEAISKWNMSIVKKINNQSIDSYILKHASKRRNELAWSRLKSAAKFLHIKMLEDLRLDKVDFELILNGKAEAVSIPLLAKNNADKDFTFDLNFFYKVISTPKDGKIVYVKIPMMIDQEIYDAWKSYISFAISKELPVFHKWVIEIAEVAKKENANKIVFDIRENTGGWSNIGIPVISLFKSGDINVYKTNFRRSYDYWNRIHESTPGLIKTLKKQIEELEETSLSLAGEDKKNILSRIESIRSELRDEENDLSNAKRYLKDPLPESEELYTQNISWKLVSVDNHTPLNIKVDMLTNWKTGSAAEIFAMAFRSSGIGRIVGSPTGNGCNVFTENAMVKLPQSEANLKYSLGFQSWYDSELSKLPANGVQPDILVYQTGEDYLRDIDTLANEVYGIKKFE